MVRYVYIAQVGPWISDMYDFDRLPEVGKDEGAVFEHGMEVEHIAEEDQSLSSSQADTELSSSQADAKHNVTVFLIASEDSLPRRCWLPGLTNSVTPGALAVLSARSSVIQTLPSTYLIPAFLLRGKLQRSAV
jgi:hypothetical protein